MEVASLYGGARDSWGQKRIPKLCFVSLFERTTIPLGSNNSGDHTVGELLNERPYRRERGARATIPWGTSVAPQSCVLRDPTTSLYHDYVSLNWCASFSCAAQAISKHACQQSVGNKILRNLTTEDEGRNAIKTSHIHYDSNDAPPSRRWDRSGTGPTQRTFLFLFSPNLSEQREREG